MIENWARAADSVRPPVGYVVLPLDERGYYDLVRRGVSGVVRDEVAWALFSSNTSRYGSTMFIRMSTYKWQSVHAILKEGIDVLMTDPDCIFMRNPMPYLVSSFVVCAPLSGAPHIHCPRASDDGGALRRAPPGRLELRCYGRDSAGEGRLRPQRQ